VTSAGTLSSPQGKASIDLFKGFSKVEDDSDKSKKTEKNKPTEDKRPSHKLKRTYGMPSLPKRGS